MWLTTLLKMWNLLLRDIPISVLRERFDYCPTTGLIRHKFTRGGATEGDEAGTLNNKGYRTLKIHHSGKRIQIMAHVVAFAIHWDRWPLGDVDHKNTVRDANWIDNLRDCSRSNNLANRGKKGLLPKGVTLDKKRRTKPYKAQIRDGVKTIYLGHHDTPESAHEVYMIHAVMLYGEFARAA